MVVVIKTILLIILSVYRNYLKKIIEHKSTIFDCSTIPFSKKRYITINQRKLNVFRLSSS